MSNPYGPGQGPEDAGWQPYSEPTVVGQPQFGQYPPQGPGGQPPPADPNYGAYQPYAQPAPGTWPQGGGGGPVPPAKSKKPLFIALGVAGVVVLVVILVLSLVVFTGDSESGEPDAVVTSYLQALADGDSAEALGLMKAPASELLLTDDVLKKQQKIAAITDVKIIDTSDSGDNATVQATYMFGDRKADETFSLTKAGDDWRLDDGAVVIDISYFKDGIPGLTVFGVPVDNESKIYVFPGPVEWGTSDENFTVVDENQSEFAMSGNSYGSANSPTVDLSSTGTAAVQSAIQAYVDNCALSKETDASVDKPGCEQDVYAFDAEPASAVWTAPTDLDAVEYRVGYDDPNQVSINGDLAWSVTYRTKPYGSLPAETKTETTTQYLYGDIDLSADEPVFTPS
ncbi:DUF4878 domain-containing protein [Nocardia sp. 348MFTsu5.1]|uniref:Rv0361 family membrane protein n=1 Tax=Nocardia sp. 348MFTsu5.1 TaxID=1172185 RepID=UPI00048F1751|nr:DUF4878 domain-containing protein [Nocardia sp. 348MFTsu5.1]